ncbi:MAG: alpha/beta fold hydrolase [Gemmatimonadaceae bacterium]|nr:alpha/beta fold hydrolase [Gemmatimonadaceae bacterium]
MPMPIPAPRANGMTTTTPMPLYWARHGREGGPPLLVLHGGPGASHEYLLPQMLRLGATNDLLFYDQRGGGRSRTDDPTPVTWQVQVGDLAAVIEELSRDRPLTIVGYSWGALLALLYTLEVAAGRVPVPPARLVLIDPAPVNRTWRAAFEEEFQRRQAGDAVRALREELAASGLREADAVAYRQRQFELSVAGYFADPRRARDLTPFRITGRVQQSVWESLGDFDLVPGLHRVPPVPTLLVHGWHDPIPVESSFAVARALHARCVVLEASGHVPYVEQPDTLFATIEQFLNETS